MGKYGQAALKAIRLIEKKEVTTPTEAWEFATTELFGRGTASQKKGCPRCTFLGLCEEGLVRGIEQKHDSNKHESKNKDYGIKAVQLLKHNSDLASNKNELWKRVLEGEEKSHNAQMDVVLSLWNNHLIKPKD